MNRTPRIWSLIGRWPTVIGRSAKYTAIGTARNGLAPLSFCYERPLLGHEQRVWVVSDHA